MKTKTNSAINNVVTTLVAVSIYAIGFIAYNI